MTEIAYPAGGTMISLLEELERAGALTPTSLDLGGAPISYDTYESLARFLGQVGRSHCWWVGDLINWGEMVFGEEAAQAVDALGLSPGTMVNYAYTCRQVARSRRRAELSFAHHRCVAPLEPALQNHWLDLAIANGWTRSQLDMAIMDARPTVVDPVDDVEAVPGDPATVLMSLPPAELETKVREVVQAFVAFDGEIGHSYRCWVKVGVEERLDCACGLERLESAVAALGIEW